MLLERSRRLEYAADRRAAAVTGKSGALVVFAGQEEETSTLRSALGRLLGGIAVVGVAAVAIQAVFAEFPPGSGTGDGGDGGGSAMDTTTAAAEGAASSIPPGVAFFAGGVAVLLVVFGIWYLRSYRATE